MMYGNVNPYGSAFGNNQTMFAQQASPMSDERIWVSNQQAAESYLVAANGFVRLWDSSQPRFYEKSADCTGRPMAMKVYEYKEVLAQTQLQDSNYVSAEEFNEFRNKVNNFINSFDDGEVE